VACANARTPHRQSLEEAVPAAPAAAERCASHTRAGRVGGPAESALLLLVTCGLAHAAAIQRASRPAGADLPALNDMADSAGRAGQFMAGGMQRGCGGARQRLVWPAGPEVGCVGQPGLVVQRVHAQRQQQGVHRQLPQPQHRGSG